MPAQPPALLDRAMDVCRVDFRPPRRQPPAARVVAAIAVSVAGSLAADAALAAAGTAVFPSTTGYAHFQFHDYAKLTAAGVVFACLAWPAVARISSQPRWLFSRLTILATLLLWLADLYTLARGQTPQAVAVLMIMHLAIALITYNSLMRLATTGPPRRQGADTW